MARSGLPDALQRRHLIESDLDADKARRIADAYLAEGRVMESLAFLEKAGDRERLVALRGEAVAAGDVFLLREIGLRLREDLDAPTWQAVVDAAIGAGKERYAAEARRQLAAKENS